MSKYAQNFIVVVSLSAGIVFFINAAKNDGYWLWFVIGSLFLTIAVYLLNPPNKDD
mgnify:FL=1